MPNTPQPDDFRPTADWDALRLRAKLLRRTRTFFEDRGFLEVETPILSADTVVDRHLDPMSTEMPGKPPQRLWLQTSPEFAMKRMLAAGGEAIYQITRAFRLGEQGPLHNPEFTMVEWYRTGHTMADGMQLTGELCEALLGRGPAEQLSYAEAFRQYADIDPHSVDMATLRAAVRKAEIEPPATLAEDDRDGLLDLLLVERVRPNLGNDRPVLLYDYPATQAALAKIRPDDPPVAERFELFVDGIELANGYHELLDADELLGRNREVNAQRTADGKPTLPQRSRLIDAMRSGMPASTGVALGFDRVVMLGAGAKSLRQVMAFPIDRA